MHQSWYVQADYWKIMCQNSDKDNEGCAAALPSQQRESSPVREAHGRNQNRQWLPPHQLTHWNQINPQGVTLPSGILHHKWRAMHITALVRWVRATQTHQTGVEKKGLWGCRHKTDAFPLPTAATFTSLCKTRDRRLICVLLLHPSLGGEHAKRPN